MPDLLVRLYDLPDDDHVGRPPDGVVVRRALGPERRTVVAWIERTFGNRHWASECEMAFSTQPIGAFIATRDERIVGFACCDATAKGFFGPTAVIESERGRRIGEALLMTTLRAMGEQGYAYAVIGGVGPVEFYRRHLEVFEIPGSTPGIYRHLLPDGLSGEDHQ